MKPSPLDIQEKYLECLKVIGIDTLVHDIRFVEDNWESPTLGAWGLGWEVPTSGRLRMLSRHGRDHHWS